MLTPLPCDAERMKKQDSGNHRMGYINRTVNRRLAGLSMVALMVALTLLAIVSIASLQIMQMRFCRISCQCSRLTVPIQPHIGANNPYGMRARQCFIILVFRPGRRGRPAVPPVALIASRNCVWAPTD